MKMKSIIKYAAIAIGVLFIASCSSDDDWQPGQKTKDGCQQVYFPSSNESMIELNVNEPTDRSIDITVARTKSEGELTVPITVVSKSEGVQIPSEVTFADGNLTASLNITVPNEVQKGTSYEYSLLLEGDEVDPYAKLDGGSSFSGVITFPNFRVAKMWVKGAEEVLGYWHATVKDMGSGLYRIQNLMDSGLELNITLDSKNEISMSSPQWYDYDVVEDSSYPGCFYYYCNFWNGSEYEYYPFYPHGKDAYVYIEQIVMYSGDGFAAYGKLSENDSKPYFYITLCSLKLNTEKKTRDWTDYLCFEFVEDGEDFEDYLPEKKDEPDEPLGEEVIFTASFDYYKDTFGGSFNITATKVGDNGYLFEDFLGCGDDITMTINRETGEVSFEGLYSQYWDGLFYLMTSNGYGAMAYPNKGISENFINYIYFYTSEGTDYVKWNEETKTFELGTYFWLNDDYDTDYWDTLYLKLNE